MTENKKKYKTIYADPPWLFDDKLDKSRQKPYDTITMDKLSNIPVNKISEDESHLYLWVPSTLLERGLKLVRDWGFVYKCHIVWYKETKHGKPWFGMGHYFRHANEICLFGVKSNLRLKTRNTRNQISGKKPGVHHAAKPEEMYELIENNSYPDYLEMFATKKRKNWTSFGFEVDNKDIMEHFK